MEIAIVIPICAPDGEFLRLLDMLKKQQGASFKLIIMETVSDKGVDYSASLEGLDFLVERVSPEQFNHGRTRQQGIKLAGDADYVVFMTQDAIPADEYAIANLVAAFSDSKVGCCYGRQLPKEDATPFAAHARLFNYPDQSYVRTLSDKEHYGIKTAFSSDSFAAYRISFLKNVGGFPRLNCSEDMYIAAKMLIGGYKVAYRADAKVYHSHNYSIFEELKRYKEIGAFHSQQPWIMENFGKADGEGVKFVLSEARYLFKVNPLLLFPMLVRNAAKFLAYKLM